MNTKQNAAKTDEDMQWERFNEITNDRHRSPDPMHQQFTRTALNEGDIQLIITLDSCIQAQKDRIKNIELGTHQAEMKYKQTGNMQRLCVANSLSSKVLAEKLQLATIEREREKILTKTKNQRKLLETALRMTMPEVFDPNLSSPVKRTASEMNATAALKRKQLETYRLACATIENLTVDSDAEFDKEFSGSERCSDWSGSQESLNKSMRLIDFDDNEECDTRPGSGCSGGSDWRGSMDALNKTMRSIVLEDSDSE